MIPIQILVTDYDKSSNTCTAVSGGKEIDLDPFVSCAVALSDEDYAAGKGAEVVGKAYVLTSYSVYPETVVPHEGGMIAA